MILSKRVVIVVAFARYYDGWLERNFAMPFGGSPNIVHAEQTAKPRCFRPSEGGLSRAISDSIVNLRDTVKSFHDSGWQVVAIAFDHEYAQDFVFQVSEMRAALGNPTILYAKEGELDQDDPFMEVQSTVSTMLVSVPQSTAVTEESVS